MNSHVLHSFVIIMAFYALGEACSVLISHFVPGSVIGMVMLFVALCLGWVNADSIRPTAELLTKNMILLFIPTFMGVIDLWGILKLSWVEWLVVVVGSTVVVMAFTGYTVQATEWLQKRMKGRKEANQ